MPSLLLMLCAVGLALATVCCGTISPTISLTLHGVSSAQHTVLLGSQANLDFFVRNAGDEIGYQPFLDFFFPSNFLQGDPDQDGTKYDRLLDYDDCTIQGVAVSNFVSHVNLFPSAPVGSTGVSCVTHPFVQHQNGSHALVCGKTGDVWLSVLLPVLRLGPTSPVLTGQLAFTLRSDAPVAAPLPLYYRMGFWAGRDAALNPEVDPSIVGSSSSPLPSQWSVVYIIPSPVQIAFNFGNEKFVTGPSFPQQANITVSIAKSVVLTNLTISSFVPASFYVTSVSNTRSPFSIVQPSFSATTSQRELRIRFASITGSGGTDFVSTINFYVPKLGPGINPSAILDLLTPNPKVVTQTASLTAIYTSPVTSGISQQLALTATPANTTLRSILIYKTMTLVDDVASNGLSPGDTVQHDSWIQVSDYFAFINLQIQDVVSDGQSLALASGFQWRSDANSAPVTLTQGVTVIVNQVPPQSTLSFQISALLPLITDLGSLRALRMLIGPITSARITYKTLILVDYKASTRIPSYVNQGDWMDDNAVLSSQIVDAVSVLPLTLGSPPDDSGSASMQVNVMPESLKLSLYGINNQTCNPFPCQQLLFPPGTALTYRIQYHHPSTDYTEFSLSVTDPSHSNLVTMFNPVNRTLPPSPGASCYGPTDTLHQTAPAATKAPSLVSSAYPLRFSYQDNRQPFAIYSDVDILYTITLDDTPYQGVYFNFLSIAKSTENDIEGTAVQFIKVRTPYPVITKGVIASSGAQTRWTQLPPFISGSANLSSCPITSGVINASVSFDSDASNVVGGNLVTFSVMITNKGAGDLYDLVVQDSIPAGFTFPPDGISLCVARGDGTVLSIPPANASALFGADGLSLSAFDTSNGLLNAGVASLSPDVELSNGRNVLFMTYRLLVDQVSAESGSTANSWARVKRYSGTEGGKDYVTALGLDVKDSAQTVFAGTNLSLAVVNTSLEETGSENDYPPDLAIGESAVLSVIVTVPYGITSNATLSIDFPFGFLPTAGTLSTFGSGVSSSILAAGASGSISSYRVAFHLGTITAVPKPGRYAGTIEAVLDAYIQDVASNTGGKQHTVTASFSSLGLRNAGTASTTVEVVTTLLTFSKTASPSSGLSAGSNVTYTLTTASATLYSSPAYNLTISDILPAGMQLLSATASTPPSGVVTWTPSGATFSVASWTNFTRPLVVTLVARLPTNLTVGDPVSNAATASWRSASSGPSAATYSLSSSASVNTRKPSLSWAVHTTSINETSSPPAVAIGEQVSYRITVSMPPGTTDFKLAVKLPDSVATGAMLVVSSRIVSMSNTMPAGVRALVGTSGVSSDTSPGNGFDETVVFDLGSGLPVAGSGASVVFEVVGLVTNVAGNVRGTTLRPTGSLQYGKGSTISGSSSVVLTVVEPSLGAVSMTSNVTLLQGNQGVEFTVSIPWSPVANDGPAFKFILNESMDSLLVLKEGSVSGSFISQGITQTLSIFKGNTAGDTYVSIGTTSSLYRYTGYLVVKFSVISSVDIFSASVLTSVANLTWWSSSQSLESRLYSATASVSVATGSPLISSFSYHNSSILPITSGYVRAGYYDITVGQSVTLWTQIFLPYGRTPLTVTIDCTGAGTTAALRLVSSQIVSLSSGVSESALGIGASGNVSKASVADLFVNRVTWYFGIIRTSQPLQSVTLQVVMMVDDILPSNVDSAVFQPKVLINGPGFSLSNSDLLFEILEPRLTLHGGLARYPLSSIVDAGDLVKASYVIGRTSSSNSTAFSLLLRPMLPASLDLQAGTVVVALDDPTSPTYAVTEGNGQGDANVTVSIARLVSLGGLNVTVSFDTRVSSTATIGADIVQPASLSYHSVPSSGRLYTLPISLSLHLPDTTTVQHMVIRSDSVPPLIMGQQAAVGERITFRVTVTLPEGLMRHVIIAHDVAPAEFSGARLKILSAQVAFLGARISSSAGLTVGSAGTLRDARFADGIADRAVFSFGDVINMYDNVVTQGDAVELEIVTLVLDNPHNLQGVLLGAAASYSQQNLATPVRQVTSAIVIEEPLVMLHLNSSVVVSNDGYDHVEFTLVVMPSPAGAIAAAFNLTVIDIPSLDPALKLVPGTVTASSGSVVSGNAAQDSLVAVTFTSFMPNAGPAVITFRVAVNTTYTNVSSHLVVNNATATWFSLPGGAGRQYSAAASDALPARMPLITSFVILDTSSATTPASNVHADLAVGETVTFSLEFMLPYLWEFDLPVSVTINLLPASQTPPGTAMLHIVSATVYQIPSGLSELQAGDSGDLFDSNNDTLADQVRFDFGDMLTSASAVAIEVHIQAIVPDIVANAKGVTVVASAVLDYVTNAWYNYADVTVVEPFLYMNLTQDETIGDAGDAVTIFTTIEHLSSSDTAAHNLQVDFYVDNFFVGPFAVVIQPSSIVATVVTAYNVNGSTLLSVQLPALLLSDKAFNITLTSHVSDSVEATMVLHSYARLRYQSMPSFNNSMAGRINTEIEAAPYYTRDWVFSIPFPSITLSLISTSQPYTSGHSIVVLEESTFALRVVFPEASLRAVRLLSLVSGYLSYTAAGERVALTTSREGDFFCGGQSCEGLDIGALLVHSDSGLSNRTLSGEQELSVLLGNMTNVNRNNSFVDWIEIRYVTRLQLCASHTALRNTPYMLWQSPMHSTPSQITNSTENLLSLLPLLTFHHKVSMTRVRNGQTVTVTMTIFHSAKSDVHAFNVVVLDSLPPGLSYRNHSYQHVSGHRPDSFKHFSPDDTPNFVRAEEQTRRRHSGALGWHIPEILLGNNSVLQFSVTVQVLDDDPLLANLSQGLLDFEPSITWAPTPGGPRIWVKDHAEGVAGGNNVTTVIWDRTPPSDEGASLCIGGLVAAGVALVLGCRGQVYANDGWLLIDTFQFIAISAALAVPWLDQQCGNYLGWSSCFSWTLFQVGLPWDLESQYFHFLYDAGYAFKAEASDTKTDGTIYRAQRAMEDYSDTIVLPLPDFVVSFVFYFCIVLVILAICLLVLLFLYIVSSLVSRVGNRSSIESEDTERRCCSWNRLPRIIESLMLLTAAGVVRLVVLAYLPGTICGFLTLYLLLGGWSVPPLNATMGVIALVMVFAIPLSWVGIWWLLFHPGAKRMNADRKVWNDARNKLRCVFGAIYADYLPARSWFHLLIFLRKLLVGGCIGLLWQAPWALVPSVSLIYTVYLVLLVILRPYRAKLRRPLQKPVFPYHRLAETLPWPFWMEVWSLLPIPFLLLVEFVVLLVGGHTGPACLLMVWMHILGLAVFFFLAGSACLSRCYVVLMGILRTKRGEEDRDEESSDEVSGQGQEVSDAGRVDEPEETEDTVEKAPRYQPTLLSRLMLSRKTRHDNGDEELQVLTPRSGGSGGLESGSPSRGTSTRRSSLGTPSSFTRGNNLTTGLPRSARSEGVGVRHGLQGKRHLSVSPTETGEASPFFVDGLFEL